MRDERKRAALALGKLEIYSTTAVKKIGITVLVAAAAALLPDWPGLAPAGQWCLFILIIAAGLWVSEAIPAFAVSLLVIGLEIMILGRPGGVFAESSQDWVMFVEPWASPVIWLFFGGFVLAEAAAKTGLDRHVCRLVISRCDSKPSLVLIGTMGITFVFSMFISNTATTSMMMAVITPVVLSLPRSQPFAKALLMGVPFAANLGGMGTVIGSPPNAIAVGVLQKGDAPVSFLQWSIVGLPPALVLAVVVYFYLMVRYPPQGEKLDFSSATVPAPRDGRVPIWQQGVVLGTFIVTILLWMTGPLHKVPTAVVSFFPIIIFTATGVLSAFDIRKLPWDVLLMLTGGLALGVGVSETGLADWIIGMVPTESIGKLALTGALAGVCMLLSNFMSNTAATNIIVPVAAAIGTGFDMQIIIPIALAASTAMCLPVSTPPNAIAFSQGRIESKDLLAGGILMGLLGPGLAVFWSHFVL